MLNIFNIDFDKLIANLMPTFLRKKKHFDWLVSLVRPVKLIHADFIKFRDQAIYKVTHNSQVFSMENVFNDKFDHQLRRIYITDSFESAQNYIYRSADDLPQYIYKTTEANTTLFLHRTSFFSPNDVDFIITLPTDIKPLDATGLSVMINQIEELANYNKLASKRYGIVWI